MTTNTNIMNNLNSSNEVSSSKVSRLHINWGTGIVIAFALFITFILYFVFSVQSNSKYDNELVVEEYYKHDANFGQEMIRLQNAQDLKQKIAVSNTEIGVLIAFPEEFVPKEISGNISFYRASNKKFDFAVPISLSKSSLTISKDKLLGGQWSINIEWKYKGKEYLTKEMIYVQ